LKRKNGVCAACLKKFVRKFVEKIYKMAFLEGSGVPVLHIGRTVPKGECPASYCSAMVDTFYRACAESRQNGMVW
jgi:hypothetical protein